MKTNSRYLTGLLAAVAITAVVIVAFNATPQPDDGAHETTPAADVAATTIPLDEMIGMERVTVNPLARGDFPDQIDKTFSITLEGGSVTTEADVSDAAEVVTAELTFEPDGFVGWHTHPGPAIVTVVSGALTIVNELDCVARTYGEGQAFVDPGQGNIHVAHNASGEETRVYAVFLDVPSGDGPTDLLDEPGDC